MSHLLWTTGHSTRFIEEFVALLQAYDIRVLADVRRFPVSRRHPQFNKEALSAHLAKVGIEYRHLSDLGGRRKARPDSVNLGWRSGGFRGYADYMQTDRFWRALEELMRLAETSPTAIMCAQAVPWRCHRQLMTDALVAQGWTVRHILSATKADLHQLIPFAKLENGRLTYPAPTAAQPTPRLF